MLASTKTRKKKAVILGSEFHNRFSRFPVYKENLVSICFPSGIFTSFRFIYNRFVFLVELDLPISRFEDSQLDQISRVQVSHIS